MPIDVNNLLAYKNEILKAEIGALLFNLGKTHAGISNWKRYFLNAEQKFSSYKDYYKNSIFEQELEDISPQLKEFIINKIVKFPFDVKNNKKELKWLEFFKGDASNEDFIKKIFFRGCEKINSGIDKGSPKEQLKDKLWIANAFGNFKKEIDINDFDRARICFSRDYIGF